MIICTVFLSAMPGQANVMCMSSKENCHKTATQLPCNSKQEHNCDSGLCNALLSCAGCGFLKVDAVNINPAVSFLNGSPVIPCYIGDLSDFSIANWNPPKV